MCLFMCRHLQKTNELRCGAWSSLTHVHMTNDWHRAGTFKLLCPKLRTENITFMQMLEIRSSNYVILLSYWGSLSDCYYSKQTVTKVKSHSFKDWWPLRQIGGYIGLEVRVESDYKLVWDFFPGWKKSSKIRTLMIAKSLNYWVVKRTKQTNKKNCPQIPPHQHNYC